MNSSSAWLPLLLSNLVTQLPLIVVSLLALIVCMVKWRDAPAASRWTLAASLLSLFVCVAAPVSQAFMMEYVRNNGLSASGTRVYYGGLGFVWGLLRAISLGFLLIAAYAGRAATTGVHHFPPPAGYPPAAPMR